MRETNYCDVVHGTAAVVITDRVYERRALDCSAAQPLLLSLHRLQSLIAHVPRVKEMLAVDGGLERLVSILKHPCTPTSSQYPAATSVSLHDKRRQIIWSLAFQCILSIGIRGTETLRTRIVEADMTAVIASLLRNHVLSAESNRHTRPTPALALLPSSAASDEDTPMMDTDDSMSRTVTMDQQSDEGLGSTTDATTTLTHTHDLLLTHRRSMSSARAGESSDTTGDAATTEQPQQPQQQQQQQQQQQELPLQEDVVCSLQLLAYLSKYTHLKRYFQHCPLVSALTTTLPSPPFVNLFAIVEKFTVKCHPQEIQYWASVIMRNTCRRDDARGGVRQCAYHLCGKWEDSPRQFAKCRRCR